MSDITHSDLKVALENRYSPPFWSFATEVKDRSGFEWTRSADAVAFGLYESRGHEIHIFECKANRADFLAELRDVDKSIAMASNADRFWIVAPKGVVKKEELPANWGLMLVSRNKKGELKTRIQKQAPLLGDGKSNIRRGFCASMLIRYRRRMEKLEKDVVPRSEVKNKERAALERGREYERMRVDSERRRYDDLNNVVNEFQKASGISLSTYADGEKLGKDVRLIRGLKTSPEHWYSRLDAIRGQLNDVCDIISEAQERVIQIEKLGEEDASE